MTTRRKLVVGLAGLGAGLALAKQSKAQAGPMVGVSPTMLEGHGFDLTDSAVTTVSGGTPPYTYLWEHVSGTAYVLANNPAGSSTNFYWDGPWSYPAKISRWRCRVTDAASAVGYSPTVSIFFDPAG